MFNRVRRIANVLLALLLLFLFIVPGLYLKKSASLMAEHAEDARSATLAGEPPDTALRELYGVCKARAPVLRLFLPHAHVDALECAAAALLPLRDAETLLSALSAFAAALSQLTAIETVCFSALF